ncbi:MAG TPA: DNA repair protein RadC [Steroidobacteraceae bacterium]|nr:DNA repair protein RadC [Steroidobacteraceae bacterium]
MGIRDWPAAERPREKLLALGAQALSEAELLALLLGGAGRNGLDAVGRARELLARHGGLRGLLSALSASAPSAPRPRTRHEPGLGLVGYCRVLASLELARRHYEEAMRAGPALDSPTTTQGFLRARLRDSPHELFCCLHLDNRHRLIAFDELFRGTIDGASVHPREVVKQALARNAAAVILAHNHPSGVAEASQADRLITQRLREALQLVDIRVLDHLIVADNTCLSFAERGLL